MVAPLLPLLAALSSASLQADDGNRGPPLARLARADLAPPIVERYDETIRSNAKTADRMQGPLDGAWILTGPNGAHLFRLQLSDPAPAIQPPEGAWRDLTARPGPASAGLVAAIARSGAKLTIHFDPSREDPVIVSLTLGADRVWRGQLKRAGVSFPVSMSEEQP